MKYLTIVALSILLTGCMGCQDVILPTQNNKVIVATSENWCEVLNEDKAIVDFWADWCKPCIKLAPILEQLAKDNPEIKIYKLDINDEKEIYLRYKNIGIPMVIYFIKGQAEFTSIGLKTLEYYQDCIDMFFE